MAKLDNSYSPSGVKKNRKGVHAKSSSPIRSNPTFMITINKRATKNTSAI